MNNINNMNSKNEMKAYLEYASFLKNKANYQFGIDEAIRRSGLSSDVFFGSLVNYINKNVVKGRYETIFDQIISIITFNSSVDINEFLYNEGVTYQELQSNLDHYLTYFRPDIKYSSTYLAKLNNVINKYREYSLNIDKKKKLLKEKGLIVQELLTEFINTPYSLERFLFFKRIKTVDFSKYVKFAKEYNQELYLEYQKSLTLKENVKSSNIEKNILDILALMKELGDDFTGIDLFKNTIYGPKELIKCADNFLNLEDLKLFRSHVNKYNASIFLCSILANSGISELINSKLLVKTNEDTIETSESDRKMIVEDLKNNYIPVTSKLFLDDLKKHYQSRVKIKHS